MTQPGNAGFEPYLLIAKRLLGVTEYYCLFVTQQDAHPVLRALSPSGLGASIADYAWTATDTADKDRHSYHNLLAVHGTYFGPSEIALRCLRSGQITFEVPQPKLDDLAEQLSGFKPLTENEITLLKAEQKRRTGELLGPLTDRLNTARAVMELWNS
ncbi:hypothetical protein HYV82_01715 [Candidatus Woesearchaeota archaeon]|nr:hypothetical protein [Candidatus Woesearchaeota archaeon]